MNVSRRWIASALTATALAALPLVAQVHLKTAFTAELSGPPGPLGEGHYDVLLLLVARNVGKLGG